MGGFATLASLGGLVALSGNARPEDALVLRLKPELAELRDPRFGECSFAYDRAELVASLVAKGVVSWEKGVDLERLAALAEQEPLVHYRDFYYTQTELDLYSLALLASAD